MREKIKALDVSHLRMVAGNEARYNYVIHEGTVIQWVAIGWIDIRQAEPEDYDLLPEIAG